MTKWTKKVLVTLLCAAMVMSNLVTGTVQAKSKVRVSKVQVINAKNNKLTMYVGDTLALRTKVKVKPNLSKYKKVRFASSNKKIVRVSSSGKLTAKKTGKVYITVSSKMNKKKRTKIKVTVKKKPILVKEITLDKTSLDLLVKQEYPLKVTISPSNATNKNIEWSTSNDKVADVDDDGVVAAIGAGTAVITVAALDKGGKKATCTVKVSEQQPANTANGSNTGAATPASASTKPTDAAVSAKPTEAAKSEAPAPTEAAKSEAPAPTEAEPSKEPTPTPVPTAKQTMEELTQSYEYFNDYTLGWADGAIVAYNKAGEKVSLEDAGAGVYNKKTDNIFAQHIANNNWWENKIKLTAPMQYTTTDGKAHMINSMLTNFDFIADPTAIDNSDNDGKLYVYGTTEGIDYSKGTLATNAYNNHSLTILSTADMVNWTDEGTIDNQNLTNLPSTAASKGKVKNKWATKAWAPSGLKIDGDGDGEDEYYIFYTNSGAVGYVQGDSPTGPWKDDLGTVLFSQQTPNCKGVVWCFDPAVLVDKKGDAYVYFGGGTNDDKAHGKTARVCKIKFEAGTGKVLLDGEPQELDNYYMFEDSEINQFGDKYFYSYCTNFNVPGTDTLIGSGQIACYVSSDPMNISFDPTGANGVKFTDEKGVYHNYLGTILKNPSTIYGEEYNNHHHMQEFKGHEYMFYHSTILGNLLFRDNKQYRNLHVDEISVNKETDEITINPSYEGASQIEDFEPFKNKDGSVKYINATTAANSAGVKSTREDVMVASGCSINGSPMVLDEINTGDWTCIKGVNFGDKGLKNFGAEYKADMDYGMIEMFIDSPTDIKNKVASIEITEPTQGKYIVGKSETTKTVTGKHDVYFVFRGDGYKVSSWILSEDAAGSVVPDVDRPVAPIPGAEDKPSSGGSTAGWNAAKTEYTMTIDEEFVVADGGGAVEFNDDGSVTIIFNPQYPGAWFKFPEDTLDQFSSIEFTYKDSTDDGTSSCGGAVRYGDSSGDEEIKWGGLCPSGDGLQTQVIELDSEREFMQYKFFRNECEDCYLTITKVVLKK